MTPKKNDAAGPRFLSKPEPQFAVDVTEKNEFVEEQKAIEAIVQRVPESRREALRDALQQNGALVGSDDPEVAQLMSRIAAIRAVRFGRTRAGLENLPANEPKVRLRVALVSSLASGARAEIVRDPSDQGIPLIVLNDAVATPLDLKVASRAAVKALDQYGEHVDRQRTIFLRRKATAEGGFPTQPAANDTWSSLLAYFKSLPESDVAGVGKARFNHLMVTRPKR